MNYTRRKNINSFHTKWNHPDEVLGPIGYETSESELTDYCRLIKTEE